MSVRPAPPAAAPVPQDPIETTVAQARLALVTISSGLVELTATAKQGIRSAEDAIAGLERSLSLISYESKRLAEVARRRSERLAVDAGLANVK